MTDNQTPTPSAPNPDADVEEGERKYLPKPEALIQTLRDYADGIDGKNGLRVGPRMCISAMSDAADIIEAAARERDQMIAETMERCIAIMHAHKPDASFDDSQDGVVERQSLLANIETEIRAALAGGKR